MIGQTILNYKIESLLGEGGMGSVYLATHTQMSRKVAIKALLPQFMANESVKQRFKNEASTLAHLQHPNIVGLYDYLEDEKGLYLVMEYVEGTPLDDFISKVTGPMPEERAVPIMKEILQGFSYAHQKEIVHRDIKPSNIIITENDNAKILDFGIARIIGQGNQNLTKTGTQMGTVFYMSPEQVQGSKIDQRSDIYSLGVTFYQMLTGVKPYNELTTEFEIYSRIVKDDLPSPQEVYPGVPDFLVSILKKAMEKNPDERFQSCEEFLKAIEEKTPISSSISEKQSKKPANKQSSTKTSNQPTSKKPSNPTNGIATAGLVLGIIGIILSIIPFASFVGIVFCLLAIIFGAKGKSNVRNNADFISTKKTANAGFVIGIVGLIISLAMSIGTIYAMEYQDSDGDGIVDSRDNCPDEFGTMYGCPDSDGDGVEDIYDDCPDVSGTINGCPDSDEDGVADSEDNCPEVPGDPENAGCPYDTDGDGVLDTEDYCPDESGPSEHNGCPYDVKCPHCETVTKEKSVNRYVTCYSCGNEFYSCRRRLNGNYGIQKGWIYDGECDCDNCWDEN